MSINDLQIKYDGICVYATTRLKANTTAKFIVSFINLLVLAVITVFIMEEIFLAAMAFFGLELFVIRYTLWSLFGEERLIINVKSLSYQQHYGFFTTALQTINLNKRIIILPYDEVIENDQTYMKFLFQSYTENNLPDIIYHSVLHVSKADFNKFIQQIDRLFVDEMANSYEMPPIHLN